MTRTGIYAILTAAVAIVTVSITGAVFNSRFAKVTIDAWAFAAALFLIIEALYKIFVFKEDAFWPHQFLRYIRIIIGLCVFTIHICQVIYGI